MALPSSFAPIGKEDAPPVTQGRDRSLWGWVFFSGFVHAAVVGLVLFAFTFPVRRAVNYPVYTVDLVGGEKLGGPRLGTQIAPASQPKESKKAQPEPPQKGRVEKEKKVVAEKEKKTVKEIEKPQKQEKAPEKATTKELSGEMREKLLQAAMERVKQRASESSGASTSESTAEKKSIEVAKKGEPLSSGAGEGVGAMAPGSGGRGGGMVKGVEFVVYYNKMLQLIKDRWAWAGRRTDLEVTVRFGIKENGEIGGLKITQRSGDASFDDSVMRAVRSANPLAPPPEAYRGDFSDVELTFRPADLRG